jgi:thiosulfate reductase/polysulfide reductase chain A
MNVLITEERYDNEYVAEWTEGLEELTAHVQEFTPEWAAEITDLDADLIRETARVMADNLPKAAIIPGRHVTWYGNDSQRMRAVYMINALLGSYGREGGFYFSKSPYIEAYPHPPFLVAGSSGGCSATPGEESDVLPLGPTGKARADGARVKFLRGATAMQELIEPMISEDPYPIKALIIYGVNALNSIPNRARTIEAFKKLDFILVVDVLPMEHVAWADVVMPEATILERDDELWAVAHKTPYIAMREPAIEPLYETKPAWWMVRELGLRLGMDNYFRWETAQEFNNTRLMSIGSSMDKMREEGGIILQNGKPYLEDFSGSPFATHSKKIEFYSNDLALAGMAPIPVYEPVEEPPQGYFRLAYGRSPVHTFAKTQNTPTLHDIVPENEVWLNEDMAQEMGLENGQYVVMENQDGIVSTPIKLKATQRIRPDVVFMVHGFGQNAPQLSLANGKGASDNELMTRYVLDPISGGAGMRVNFVRISAAQEA